MFWMWTALAAVLAVEVFFAICLFDWKSSLDHYQEQIDRDRRICYACITGASVTSFGRTSFQNFCPEHKAHWQLINDLEAQL